MIKSMTGYGRGECTLYNRKLIVEIKSVNHRYNDVNIKIPRILNAFEDTVRKKITGKIFRGKTDVYISYETLSKDDFKIQLNESLLDAYVKELSVIKERYGLNDEISLSLITKFPDVLSIHKDIDDDKVLSEFEEALLIALDLALNQLIQMRLNEGAALKKDMIQKLSIIKSMADTIIEKAPFVASDYQKRLTQKITEALGDVNYDESRLLTEVTIFADKACIDEELTRLNSHFKQFEIILSEEQSIGRKLDFLVQEMNREVNTIGSKSNDIEIAKTVVDLKSEIEKIREQIQNIE